jgi:hypothetical protein
LDAQPHETKEAIGDGLACSQSLLTATNDVPQLKGYEVSIEISATLKIKRK